MNLERWGWHSIAVNVNLGLINLVIARASGSLAVEAEMVHNLVCLLTAVAVLIGLKLSTRKSKPFPLADGAVEEQQIVANPHKVVEKAKGIRVAEWLVAQKVDVVLVRESMRGKGPVYVFGDAGVEMRGTAATTLEEALRERGVR